MNGKKISVISIIYKVEAYLPRCIESLMAQTYENLELILVVGVKNDGSDDSCLQICEEYAAKDPRIKLIAAPAKGIADARNVGMAAVTGDYVGFVDGDDWVDEDMFASMMENLTATGSRVAVCGRYYEFVNFTGRDPEADTRVMTSSEAMEMILSGTGFFLHLWDKLFAKELFEGMSFETGYVVEDRIVVNRLLGRASRICYNSTPKYHFRERFGSSSKKSGMHWHNAVANKQLCDYVEEQFPELKQVTGRFYLQEIITSLQNLLVIPAYDAKEKKEFTEEIKKTYKSNRHNPLISKNLRIKTMLALYMPFALKVITARHQKAINASEQRFE